MDEHKGPPFELGCPLGFLASQESPDVEDLEALPIRSIIDLPKSDIAAYIFGAYEPCGQLFTNSHEFVIVDSEQMFLSAPCAFATSPWLVDRQGLPSLSGRALAFKVCQEISSLESEFLNQIVRTPKGLAVQMSWHIQPKLRASIAFAAETANLRW